MRRKTVTIFPIFAVMVFSVASRSSAQDLPDQPALKAASTLIEFDAPNASLATSFGTQPFANNNLGVVVGVSTDVNIVPHGFLRTPEGEIVSFDAPGADLNPGDNGGTVAFAINDRGQITGQFEDTAFVFHGFIRQPDGTFFEYDEPDAGAVAFTGTMPANINPRGDTAGFYFDGNGQQHGFIRYADGTFVNVDPPGSAATMICLETCLNPDGVVTGFFVDSVGNVDGFIRSAAGEYTIVDLGNDLSTLSASITPSGAIAGFFNDSNNLGTGFIRSSNDEIESFQDPQANLNPNVPSGTVVFAINSMGATTGEYFDANSNQFGFLRTRDGRFASFSAPDGGTGCSRINLGLGCAGTRPSTLNIHGQVTGWYLDANYAFHGFIWTPGTDSFSHDQTRVLSSPNPNIAGESPSPHNALSRFLSNDPGSKALYKLWLSQGKH